MLESLLKSVFGSKHDRDRPPGVADRRRDQPGLRVVPRLTDDGLRGKTAEFKARIAEALKASTTPRPARPRNGRPWTTCCPRRSPPSRKPAAAWCGRRLGTWSGSRCLGHGALRRAAHRRHRAPRGQDRRDGDRRRQDAGRHPAALSERAHRARAPTWSPSTTTSRGATASGWARSSSSSGSRSAASRTRWTRRAPRGQYALRHHLRHQQRVRLRLPARQHGGAPRAPRAARLRLRDRRRGRLGPDRRGAHAAHHLAARSSTATRSSTSSSRVVERLVRAPDAAGEPAARRGREAARTSREQGVRGRASSCCRSSARRPSTSAS